MIIKQSLLIVDYLKNFIFCHLEIPSIVDPTEQFGALLTFDQFVVPFAIVAGWKVSPWIFVVVALIGNINLPASESGTIGGVIANWTFGFCVDELFLHVKRKNKWRDFWVSHIRVRIWRSPGLMRISSYYLVELSPYDYYSIVDFIAFLMEGSHFEIMLWTSENPLQFRRVVKKFHQAFYLLWILAGISNTCENVRVNL